MEDYNPPRKKSSPTPEPILEGSDVIQWTNSNGGTLVSAPIANGNYSNKKCSFQDLDLISANILQGASIFGVLGGLAPTGAAASCQDNQLNNSPCTTALNRYVSGTLGGERPGTNGSLSVSIGAGFYDGTKSCTISDTNLASINIKNGVSIFGVTGNVVPAYVSCSDNVLNALPCSTGVNRYIADNLCGLGLQTASGCFASNTS